MMTRDERIMKRVKEHYEEACSLEKEVVAVFLQGSQNYKLDEYSDEYMSDIDTKCIILPTLDDIVNSKSPYSSTHVCANNEHIDIKDIRVMFEMFKKQNNAYIELLFTKYYYINPKYEKLVMELKTLAESISRMYPNQALRCMAGTSAEKYKALEHPYPNTMEKINKFGYDPKQLHHILRLNDFMKRFIAGESYESCLVPKHIDYLMKVKKGLYSLNEARLIALEVDQENKKLKEDNLQSTEIIDKETVALLEELKVKFIKQFLIETLLNSEN